jgi:hypothetical protein
MIIPDCIFKSKALIMKRTVLKQARLLYLSLNVSAMPSQLAGIHAVVTILLLFVCGGHIRRMDHQIVYPPTLELVMNPEAEVAGFVYAVIASPGELAVQVTNGCLLKARYVPRGGGEPP